MVMVMFIMENEKIVKKMEKELLFIKVEINMMEIGKMEKRVVKEFIILKMEIFLKENGKMEKNLIISKEFRKN